MKSQLHSLSAEHMLQFYALQDAEQFVILQELISFEWTSLVV